MCIKQLTANQIPEAMKLVKEVFMEYEAPDYSEKGINTFLSFIEADNITKYLLAREGMEIWGYFIDDKIVGVLSVRQKHHISLLFVAKENQNQGIAKALFVNLIDERRKYLNDTVIKITVNSSPYAVEVYEHLGFSKIGEEMKADGIRFTPMVWKG